MNTRILVATVAGGAALFLLGFVMYDLVLGTYLKGQMIQYPGLMNEAPNFVTLIVANIVWALLVALIFDRWATISTFAGGAIGGAMITFFMALYFDLMNVTFMNLFNSFIPVITRPPVRIVALSCPTCLARFRRFAVWSMVRATVTALRNEAYSHSGYSVRTRSSVKRLRVRSSVISKHKELLPPRDRLMKN